jgi:hypothetical protein
LIDSHGQLAAAARRYPNGLDTIHEELEAEMKRRQSTGEAGEGHGYAMAGDPSGFDRQLRLMDAARTGEFARSIEDALTTYDEDTRNYAPKEYWPSTGAFRTVFCKAGQRLGTDAVKLLEQIPDNDLRLFAFIELAAALEGAPGPWIMTVKQPHPHPSGQPG